MISTTVFQFLTRFILLLALVAIASSARPHFDNINQVTADQDASALIDQSGLTNEQFEQIVQRLIENNRFLENSRYPVGLDRLVRGPEMKRQSRFRQCYFNPVSCFKK